MTCREAVCGAVKTDIKRGLAVVDHLFDFRFVRHLRDKSARDELFINSHSYFSFHFVHKIKKPPHENRAEGELPRYHLCSLLSESQEHCALRITHACGSAYYNCSASQLGDVFRRPAASPHSARRLSLPAQCSYFFPSQLLKYAVIINHTSKVVNSDMICKLFYMYTTFIAYFHNLW